MKPFTGDLRLGVRFYPWDEFDSRDLRRGWSRGNAWRALLATKPTFEVDGLVFQPMDHHFRKCHREGAWGWYVAYWKLVSGTPPSKPPTQVPAPIVFDGFSREAPYIWGSWTDLNNEKMWGFILNDEVVFGETGPGRIATITIKRHVEVGTERGSDFSAVAAVVAGEVSRFPGASFEARHNFDDAVDFLRTKGIVVEIDEGGE